jgi:hypothetical protein
MPLSTEEIRKLEQLYKSINADGHIVTDYIDSGRIGHVFKAVNVNNSNDIVACKLIPSSNVKKGWTAELDKLVKLNGVPNVVNYRGHGSEMDKENFPTIFVKYELIKGRSLRFYINQPQLPIFIDVPFIEKLFQTVLQVMHACKTVEVSHGDLHEGNILIADPDNRLIDSSPRVMITDFGYGGSHNNKQPKDDFKQVGAIILSLLDKVGTPSNERDRLVAFETKAFIKKRIFEHDPTQGRFVREPKVLLEEYQNIIKSAPFRINHGTDVKTPGDYLVAEAMGFRIDEWKSLFVPEFLGRKELLKKNITVLTGARGCGKTMSFRRLTEYMNTLLGDVHSMPETENFIGFYLSCHDLLAAFPWLPNILTPQSQQQIIHFFHLCWLHEITRTLIIKDTESQNDYSWLESFLDNYFPNYSRLPKNSNTLAHIRSFIDIQKEYCRRIPLGSKNKNQKWSLGEIDFLDVLIEKLLTYTPWFADKPFYFFLDDYTIPTIARQLQKTLNPVIFRRRSSVFFKISTESSNSFLKESINDKQLELNHDFELIDLATESLHEQYQSKKLLLNKIFKPRIDRDEALKKRNLTLSSLLGDRAFNNNEFAHEKRNTPRRNLEYSGIGAFVGMWASDVRTMIQMLSEMLRDYPEDTTMENYEIPSRIQDKTYKAAGGELMVFTESVTNPNLDLKAIKRFRPDSKKSFGKRMREIVEAFSKVSLYELTKGELVSNEGRMNPKQAFRIEIINQFELNEQAIDYYDGVIRWHIFLQDWRGKSVRGMITPRLYLNRLLIPFLNLTFSQHDNIQLTNEEFGKLLIEPDKFFDYWKQKRSKSNNSNNSGPKLF